MVRRLSLLFSVDIVVDGQPPCWSSFVDIVVNGQHLLGLICCRHPRGSTARNSWTCIVDIIVDGQHPLDFLSSSLTASVCLAGLPRVRCRLPVSSGLTTSTPSHFATFSLLFACRGVLKKYNNMYFDSLVLPAVLSFASSCLSLLNALDLPAGLSIASNSCVHLFV